MAACVEEYSVALPSATTNTPQLTCKHCLKLFDASTGGRCMECPAGVNYCTKACQVGAFSNFNSILDGEGAQWAIT